jgi:molybdopterin-binding protein
MFVSQHSGLDSALNVIRAPIRSIAELGNRARLAIGSVSAEITAEWLARLGLEPGRDGVCDVQGDRHPCGRRTSTTRRRRIRLELSTRNQLRGTVTDVKLGTIMAEVTVDVGGQTVVAAVTRGGLEQLGLAAGDDVTVLIKATEVMLGK